MMKKFSIYNKAGTFLNVGFADGSRANINAGEKLVGIRGSLIGEELRVMARRKDVLIQEEGVSKGKFARASDEPKPKSDEEISKSEKKHKMKEN